MPNTMLGRKVIKMSCYVCEKDVFSYLASVIFACLKDRMSRSDAVMVGRALYRQNCLSYMERYRDENVQCLDIPIISESDIVSVDLYKDEVLEAIRHLKHQLCETSDWENTLSKKVLDMLKELISKSTLKDSGRPVWGVPESFYNRNTYEQQNSRINRI